MDLIESLGMGAAIGGGLAFLIIFGFIAYWILGLGGVI
jgi:hypothetical protein